MPKGVHTSPRNPLGRGAQPTHPGFTIKSVLMGQIPLDDGRLVTEAAIVDVFRAYKEVIRQVNHLRPIAKRLKGPSYPSFYPQMRFARYLGLVEFVREEPMESPPPTGHLYSLRKIGDEVKASISTRRVYRLTVRGKEEEAAWGNLTVAYREALQAGLL